MKANVCLSYNDGSEVRFDFECSEPDRQSLATLMMVCQGTLLASSASRIVAYDNEGFDICSYFRNHG